VLGSLLSAAEISSLSFIDQLRLTLVVTSSVALGKLSSPSLLPWNSRGDKNFDKQSLEFLRVVWGSAENLHHCNF
jgi:hypothetical protein